MQASKYEQETIINYNQAECTASVYTHNASLIRKLDSWVCEKDASVVVKSQGDGWREYLIPKRWIKIQKPRQYTDEQRQLMADRARSMRFGRDK